VTGALGRRANTLRFIADRLGLPELRVVIRQPGIDEAYRLTVQYFDGRHPDQVATLTRARDGTVLLTVAYRRMHHQPVFEYPLQLEQYRDFDLALRKLGFDRRDDQPDMPYMGQDFWLIERASGSFFHDMVLSPERAEGAYGWIVEAVRGRLPQAVRVIQPD
jgi:hypothetical protein